MAEHLQCETNRCVHMVMEWQHEGVSQVAQVFIEPPQCLWPPLLQYLCCVLVPFINV